MDIKTNMREIQCPVCNIGHFIAVNQKSKNNVFASTCESCGHFFKFRVTPPFRSEISLIINEQTYKVGNEYKATTTLNEFLRLNGISTATKKMCSEGGCGVCVVAVEMDDPMSDKKKTCAFNSCLVPLFMCDRWNVTTAEGLGNKRKGYHEIQKKLTEYNGSQCGFCTPGQIMNMYGLMQQNPDLTEQDVEDAFGGQICRCTGYRPILEAFRSFASSDGSKNQIMDIEETVKRCKKTGSLCNGICSQRKPLPLHMVLSDAQWFKPTSLTELFNVIDQHKVQSLRLVFGNTGTGVFSDIGPWNYDVLVDIRGVGELYNISFDVNGNIGAAITLTELINTFNKNSEKPGFSYLRTLSSHLKKVAHLPVRNSGTWAGNLMMKHKHTAFPSDVFTMFETVGAKLRIGGPGVPEKEYSLTNFLGIDMSALVIESLILSPMTDDTFIRTYKVAPRHQNAIGYVNAGFRMKLDKDDSYVVKETPSIIYSGINSNMIHATQTEQYLTGRSLTDPTTLKGAFTLLSSEIIPDIHPVRGSTEYRKSIALTLFYRYVLNVCSEKVDPRYISGGEDLVRALSSGQQSYDTKKEEWPLTEPMTKLSALKQTSGEAEYIDDLPLQKGELHAAFVITTIGNGQIQSIDPSVALKYPGVVKFLTFEDIPEGGVNNFMPYVAGKDPEEVFCSGQVLYAGQAVGLIIAETQSIADIASGMVEVTYTDVQPPILTIDDAIEKKSFFNLKIPDIKRGDAEGAIANSPRKISGSIFCDTQYHYQMETQVCMCTPYEDGMHVLASTQWTDATQQAVSNVLGIPNNNVTVDVKRLGGAYGSKISRNFPVSTACALAAHIMNKPVRLRMDFSVNMDMIGKRVPHKADYEIGCDDDGILNGIKITYYTDCGCHSNESMGVSIQRFGDNAYFSSNWHLIQLAIKTNTPSTAYTRGPVYWCPNWHANILFCKTNIPSTTAARAPGSTPGIFIMENIMEQIAKELNMDPSVLKYNNLYQNGQVTPLDMTLKYCSIRDLMTQLETSASVTERKQEIENFNQNNRWKKKGLSVVPLKYGVGWSYAAYNCYVTIYNGDGTVVATHGGVECGQGINTKVAQVVAYELKIPINLVTVQTTNTLTGSNSSTTGGSITSELCCKGIIACCNQLNSVITPVREKMKDPTWLDVIRKCFQMKLDLTARYWTNPHNGDDSFQYNCYGVTATEVEFDVLTGENQITRVDMLYDCGQSMNPELDIGQIEGAFVMGLGYWLTERIVYDTKTGKNLTNRVWNYHPPTSQDIPIDFRIQLLKNAPNPLGVLSSKACGEPPLNMSCSALFALKHAVQAARKEIGQDDYFPLNGPATVDVLQTKCLLEKSQFVLEPDCGHGTKSKKYI